MRNLILIFLLLFSLAAGAEEMAENEPLKLKDGSYLFINDDGSMRMVDNTGKPVSMREGVEMELEDGSLIIMVNKKIWRLSTERPKP